MNDLIDLSAVGEDEAIYTGDEGEGGSVAWSRHDGDESGLSVFSSSPVSGNEASSPPRNYTSSDAAISPTSPRSGRGRKFYRSSPQSPASDAHSVSSMQKMFDMAHQLKNTVLEKELSELRARVEAFESDVAVKDKTIRELKRELRVERRLSQEAERVSEDSFVPKELYEAVVAERDNLRARLRAPRTRRTAAAEDEVSSTTEDAGGRSGVEMDSVMKDMERFASELKSAREDHARGRTEFRRAASSVESGVEGWRERLARERNQDSERFKKTLAFAERINGHVLELRRNQTT